VVLRLPSSNCLRTGLDNECRRASMISLSNLCCRSSFVPLVLALGFPGLATTFALVGSALAGTAFAPFRAIIVQLFDGRATGGEPQNYRFPSSIAINWRGDRHRTNGNGAVSDLLRTWPRAAVWPDLCAATFHRACDEVLDWAR
jgi:hypothetical protein